MRKSTSRLRRLLAYFVLLLAILGCSSLLPTSVPIPTEDQHLDIPRVSLQEAVTAYTAGAAVFVDVRGLESYKVSHIPGAISIPVDQIASRLDEFDTGQWIITYCT